MASDKPRRPTVSPVGSAECDIWQAINSIILSGSFFKWALAHNWIRLRWQSSGPCSHSNDTFPASSRVYKGVIDHSIEA